MTVLNLQVQARLLQQINSKWTSSIYQDLYAMLDHWLYFKPNKVSNWQIVAHIEDIVENNFNIF